MNESAAEGAPTPANVFWGDCVDHTMATLLFYGAHLESVPIVWSLSFLITCISHQALVLIKEWRDNYY